MSSERTTGRAPLINKWTTREGAAYVDAMVDVLAQRPPERLPFVDYVYLRIAVAASGVGRFVSMTAFGKALDRLAASRGTWSRHDSAASLSREELYTYFNEASVHLVAADEELRKLALLADGRDADGNKITPPPSAAQLRQAMRDGYEKLWRRYPPDLPADQRFDHGEVPDSVVPAVKQPPRTRLPKSAWREYQEMARPFQHDAGWARVHRPKPGPPQAMTQAELEELWRVLPNGEDELDQ